MGYYGCDCGAMDCIRCRPDRFINGRYRYVDCAKCGCEFEPESEDDEICDGCQEIIAEERARRRELLAEETED